MSHDCAVFPQEHFQDILATWTANCPAKTVEVSIQEDSDSLAIFKSFNQTVQFLDGNCRKLPVPTAEHNDVNLFVLDLR